MSRVDGVEWKIGRRWKKRDIQKEGGGQKERGEQRKEWGEPRGG